MYGLILLLHLLGATIWTGGHIVLATCILPRVLRERSPRRLQEFEQVFEKIGMPALIVQVVTGLWLAWQQLPDLFQWFDMSNPVAHGIAAKLLLLVLTVGFALDAKLRVLPRFDENKLVDMAWHIVPVTVFSVLFVVVGISFRTGWLY